MNKEKLLELSKAIINLLGAFFIFPISLAIFFSDRLILSVLIHLEAKDFKAWIASIDNVIKSLYRIMGVTVIYGVYKLLQWIF
jgi:hypothetical protein